MAAMITIANANALHILLADRSVQCIVTSPPYWGLRDYGTAKWEGGSAECDHASEKVIKREMHQTHASGRGAIDTEIHVAEFPQGNCIKCGARRIDAQIGLESTPASYVANIVAVMRECWRVLKDDGTLWLNLGDSYAREGGNTSGVPRHWDGREHDPGGQHDKRPNAHLIGLKQKDLIGIPWRVAFALQEDGWYLRSDIIWAKPNPMPESVTDRCTKAHEYIFLLTKQARYYYDAEAIKEPISEGTAERYAYGFNSPDKKRKIVESGKWHTGKNGRDNLQGDMELGNGRNRRSVWTVATQPYSGSHFAVFPMALIEPMILAGTSARGECPHCGKAWVRVVEKIESENPAGYNGSKFTNGKTAAAHTNTGNGNRHESVSTGWRASCACPPHEPIPQTVLDPFAGSGTTGAVAVKLGRRAVLLDLNTKYIDLQFERTNGVQMVMPE